MFRSNAVRALALLALASGCAHAANVRGQRNNPLQEGKLKRSDERRLMKDEADNNKDDNKNKDNTNENTAAVPSNNNEDYNPLSDVTMGDVVVSNQNNGGTVPAPANPGTTTTGTLPVPAPANPQVPAPATTPQVPPPPSQATPSTTGGSDGISPAGTCPQNRDYVDVVIIGAGMAGIRAAATLMEQDPNLTYRLVESTDRVGGRVRSHSFGAWTVEDGANWIVDFNNNPMAALADQYQLKNPLNDLNDFVTYNADGTPADPALVNAEVERFMQAWEGAEADAENQWTPDHESYPDQGVRDLLAKQGWQILPGQQGDLDFTVEWSILDWEYASRDTSIRYFPFYYTIPVNQVTDQRGYEYLPQQYFQTNTNTANLRTQHRVKFIHYNENVPYNGKTYKVVVSADQEVNGVPSSCVDFYAQRVISTVSSGVITNDLIQFNPPLAYSHQQYNPFWMTQYVKIFYQFDSQFWDSNEFIRTVRDEMHRGQCHHWANMNHEKFYPGSNIIRCEIMTEAFTVLKDPTTGDLTQDTLLRLLDPLRAVYGADVVGTPVDIYYPKLNKDKDFGYGAYANWKIGKTFTDFGRFFGGVPDIVPYCQHNGCNSNGEWTMIFSGAATCFDWAEFVHGAWFAGEKAARQVLQELGYDIKFEVSPCDVDLVWLKK